MMKNSFAAVLLLSFVLSAFAEIQGCRLPDQKFQFPLEALPGGVGYFYCEAQPTVALVTLIPSNAYVNGIDNGGVVFPGDMGRAFLNKVYFTFSLGPFTGAGPGTLNVEYVGSPNEVVCYEGKGNRSLEFKNY